MIKNKLRTNNKGRGAESSWGSQKILQIEDWMYSIISLSDGQWAPTLHCVCGRVLQYFDNITTVFLNKRQN